MASGYDGHISKRQKMDEGLTGYNDIQDITPSKVIHIRGLPDYANEDDIVAAVRHFGQVDYVLPMPKKHQALVEFRDCETVGLNGIRLNLFQDISSSRACVNFANIFHKSSYMIKVTTNKRKCKKCIGRLIQIERRYFKNNRLTVGDYQIFANFSTSSKIQRGHQTDESFNKGPSGPHNILLFTVVNAQYPITVDVMHTICSPHGRVEKIVIFKKQFVQSMVQFDCPESARKAREQLHGCDIYSGCCTLRIEYAKAPELNVKVNNTESWDYSCPNPGKIMGTVAERKNPPLLADPRYAPAPTPYGEVDEYGGDGFRGQLQGGGGQSWGRSGGCGTGFQSQGQGVGGFDAPYIPAGRGGGRGVSVGGYSAQGRQPGGYGGQDSWNQEGLQQRGFGRGGRQDTGFGQGLMGQQGGFMEQQSTGIAGGAPAQGCVVMVYGLNPDKVNCYKVFNLFCLYGNIIRIKFLRSKEGSAMVQMGDNISIERAMFNLNGVYLFGKKIAVTHSKQAFLQDVINPHNLPDGTTSFKDFTSSRNNRFMTPEAAAKNRILHPTECVHYYNAPPSVSEDEMIKLFEDNGAAPPSKILQFQKKSDKSSSGLLEWERKSDATEALCLVNHVSVPNPAGKPYVLKLCFSQGNIRK